MHSRHARFGLFFLFALSTILLLAVAISVAFRTSPEGVAVVRKHVAFEDPGLMASPSEEYAVSGEANAIDEHTAFDNSETKDPSFSLFRPDRPPPLFVSRLLQPCEEEDGAKSAGECVVEKVYEALAKLHWGPRRKKQAWRNQVQPQPLKNEPMVSADEEVHRHPPRFFEMEDCPFKSGHDSSDPSNDAVHQHLPRFEVHALPIDGEEDANDNIGSDQEHMKVFERQINAGGVNETQCLLQGGRLPHLMLNHPDFIIPALFALFSISIITSCVVYTIARCIVKAQKHRRDANITTPQSLRRSEHTAALLCFLSLTILAGLPAFGLLPGIHVAHNCDSPASPLYRHVWVAWLDWAAIVLGLGLLALLKVVHALFRSWFPVPPRDVVAGVEAQQVTMSTMREPVAEAEAEVEEEAETEAEEVADAIREPPPAYDGRKGRSLSIAHFRRGRR